MTKKLITLLLLSVFLGGCATSPPAMTQVDKSAKEQAINSPEWREAIEKGLEE
jgi:PBP1b-binding outer membrane lipoprotein LpoB